MKQPKKLLLIYLASLIIVSGVDMGINFRFTGFHLYTFGMLLSIAITTFCWIGFLLLYHLFFKKMVWSDRPTLKIVSGAFVFAAVGVIMMLIGVCVQDWVTHTEASLGDIFLNCTYAALFSMIVGLMVVGHQSLIHLKKSIEDNERMKQEMIQSQYETLKSQVNPHFLFNSLNTLTVMIPRQPEVAVQFVEQMSKVFRYSLQHSGENTIDLGTELKVVQAYLFLNEQRYDGKLIVDIKVGESVLQQKIITQSLLMLIENAIKHNEISHENPLSVSIYNEENYLVVKNTLQRKSLVEQSTNVGLDNIKKRYSLASDIPVVVEEGNNLFIVKIPLLN